MITKQSIAILHKQLDAAMKAFADANGLVASGCRLSYNANGFEVRGLQFSTKDANPDAIDPRYLADLKRGGMFVGLDTSMIGTELILSAKRGMSPKYKFVGMRASKAVCVNLGDNKPYLWDAKFISSQIKLQAAKV